MISQKITIKNKLGLHARAAVKLVNLANRFVSSVKIEKDGNEIDGKSILGILTLAAVQGSEITLKVEGKDEAMATQAILSLINDKFHEDE
jgi:phosphocarrier protein HPr